MIIDAEGLGFSELNERIRNAGDSCEIYGCIGQRFIAAGMGGKKITISSSYRGLWFNWHKIMDYSCDIFSLVKNLFNRQHL